MELTDGADMLEHAFLLHWRVSQGNVQNSHFSNASFPDLALGRISTAA
jgi:hypothetical protein